MYKVMKKSIALLVCCIMLFYMASCGGESNTSIKDTLTVAAITDYGNLDSMNQGTDLLNIAREIAQPLLKINPNGEIEWILATGMDWDLDNLKLTIHLREGVTFSNGNPFNADDYLFTLDRFENTPGRTKFFPAMDSTNMKKIDDYTIELTLLEYDFTMVQNFGTLYAIYAESFDEEEYAVNPIGTGPYILEEYVINSHVYLKRNENYWGEPAKIPNLRFKYLAEPAQRVNALETGEVDCANIPLQDIDYVSSFPGVRIETKQLAQVTTAILNFTDYSTLNSVEARYAVCHAIDRQAIVDLVYNGYGKVSDYPSSSFSLDYDPRWSNLNDTYAIGYDPDLAREYAEKAGIIGKDIVIITNGTSNFVAVAEIVQQNLRDIGLNPIINNYDAAAMRTIGNDPTMFDIYINDRGAPSRNSAQVLWAFVKVIPYVAEGQWPGHDRYMELIDQVMGIPDKQERSDVLLEMNQIIADAALWYSLCDYESAYAIPDTIDGFVFNTLSSFNYNEWSYRQ